MKTINDVLTKLARNLIALGFYDYDEPIEEWLEKPHGSALWLLANLRRSVWHDYANVGEPSLEWLDAHPRPDLDEDALERWEKDREAKAKEPYRKAERLIDRATNEIIEIQARPRR